MILKKILNGLSMGAFMSGAVILGITNIGATIAFDLLMMMCINKNGSHPFITLMYLQCFSNMARGSSSILGLIGVLLASPISLAGSIWLAVDLGLPWIGYAFGIALGAGLGLLLLGGGFSVLANMIKEEVPLGERVPGSAPSAVHVAPVFGATDLGFQPPVSAAYAAASNMQAGLDGKQDHHGAPPPYSPYPDTPVLAVR